MKKLACEKAEFNGDRITWDDIERSLTGACIWHKKVFNTNPPHYKEYTVEVYDDSTAPVNERFKVYAKWGRIGAAQQSTIKHFDSAQDAKYYANGQIQLKMYTRGYSEKDIIR